MGAFEAPEAHRLAHRFEFHSETRLLAERPGSGQAREVPFCPRPRVLGTARQALGERVLVTRWLEARRERAVEIGWQFTTSDARLKLERLYPEMTG